MAATTRGKLKENFEGVHRNFEWIQRYCERSVILLKEMKPELTKAVKGLHKSAELLDKLAQDIYSRL